MVIFRRRESTDVEDLFIAHISGMDTLARGLRNVAKLIEVIYSFFLCSIPLVFLQFFLAVALSSFSCCDKRMVLLLSLLASDIKVLIQSLGL